MFRFAVGALAIVGLVALFSGGVGWAAAGVGAMLFIPFLILKILFFMMLFTFVARVLGRGWGRGPWRWDMGRPPGGDGRPPWGGRTSDRRPGSAPSPGQTEEDRFREWHDLHHARKEVDSWVPDLDDPDLADLKGDPIERGATPPDDPDAASDDNR